MESERNSSTSENKVEENELIEEEEQQQERNEILKRRISSHPLYGLLVDAHMECLKVGDIANMDKEQKLAQKQAMKNHNLGMLSQSELDLFMEAYCLALGKLKEAMEEPQQKSMAFINSMHSQLREMTIEHAATTSSDDSKNKTDSSI